MPPPRKYYYTHTYNSPQVNARRNFFCELEQGQCHARTRGGGRCTRQMILGLEFCKQHLMSERSLEIRENSAIPGRQYGIYAKAKANAPNPIFSAGDMIAVFDAEEIDEEEAFRRYGKGPKDYLIKYKKQNAPTHTILDAGCRRTVASLTGVVKNNLPHINPNAELKLHTRAEIQATFDNEIFDNQDGNPNEKMYVICATDDIENGSEILLRKQAIYSTNQNTSPHVTSKTRQQLKERAP